MEAWTSIVGGAAMEGTSFAAIFVPKPFVWNVLKKISALRNLNASPRRSLGSVLLVTPNLSSS
jgi:hypothetical protein